MTYEVDAAPRPSRLPAPGIGTRILAGIGIAGLLAGFGLMAADAAEAAPTAVTGVNLSWTLSEEAGGGAYFGGCNFLSAGASADNGGSAVWVDDSLYTASAGNVSITKPNAEGNQVPVTWETKCLDASGAKVTTLPGSTSANQVNLANGAGTVDVETGDASISWDGAFTVVFYGGMTYWSVDELRLELTDGKGTLTGTASGFGTDMADATKWQKVDARTVTLATIDATPAELTASGVTITPDYRGVDAGSVATPQIRTEEDWGSWPRDFVGFHAETGQSSYWYSSGGAADPKKVAAPLTLTFNADQTLAATAAPVFDRVPVGYDEGLEVRFSNLGEAVNGEAILRDGNNQDLELKAGSGAGPGAQITAGGGTGTWDVSGLDLGVHSYSLVVRDGDTEQPIELASGAPISITVVSPLSADASPTIALGEVSSTSAALDLTWPEGAGGPPTSYEVQVLLEDGTAVGDVRRVPANPGGTGATIVSGLGAATDYTLKVTPYLATVAGASATQPVVTSPAPVQTPAPTPEPTTAPPAPTTPSDGGGGTSDGATLYWGLSQETTSGAYYGGCNFLAAGKAGDTGSARLWTAGDYRSADGNVTIVKPYGGGFAQASWGDKCLDRNGNPVSSTKTDQYTEAQVRITGGETTRGAAGISIQWRGSFTVAFYGGMSYWSATDPRLEVGNDGRGRITATASGYGASMEDLTKWTELGEQEITLANLEGVDLSNAVISHLPEYLGVTYSGSGEVQSGQGTETRGTQVPKSESRWPDSWGAFPSDFIEFQKQTGQFSYWFSSNGARDPAKPTLPVTVSLDGAYSPPVGSYTAQPSVPLTQSNSVTNRNGTRTSIAPVAPPTTAAPVAGTATGGGAAQSGATPVAAASEATGLQIGEISAPMVLGSGAGLLAVAGLNWSIGLLLRRRLGLDPHLFG